MYVCRSEAKLMLRKGVPMDVKEMRALVAKELKHISKQPKPIQGELRMVYQTLRMHSLGKKAKKKQTARDVLLEAVKIVRKDNPTAKFEYDKEFFANKTKGK
jgi:hypothetical protein